jgi:protein-tyrosine-phosphatase
VIVFVCEHGSAKSLVAALFLERLARERGLALRGVSRGVVPDESVPDAVLEGLRGDGFDAASFRPRALEDADLSTAVRVVAIGLDLHDGKAPAGSRLERWDDIPPLSESYPRAREAIVSRLTSLLRGLETHHRRK